MLTPLNLPGFKTAHRGSGWQCSDVWRCNSKMSLFCLAISLTYRNRFS